LLRRQELNEADAAAETFNCLRKGVEYPGRQYSGGRTSCISRLQTALQVACQPEQRPRVDPIGQTYDKVWIYNHFYCDTIEDRIYHALKDRINWFEDVVGTLQPILADVNKMTRDLAMLPAERQAAELDQAIRRLREEIDQATMDALNLDEFLEHEDPNQGLRTPVMLANLEATLTQSRATRHLFTQHPEIADAYLLQWRDTQIAVTFSATQFDTFPDSLQLLSYDNPILT